MLFVQKKHVVGTTVEKLLLFILVVIILNFAQKSLLWIYKFICLMAKVYFWSALKTGLDGHANDQESICNCLSFDLSSLAKGSCSNIGSKSKDDLIFICLRCTRQEGAKPEESSISTPMAPYFCLSLEVLATSPLVITFQADKILPATLSCWVSGTLSKRFYLIKENFD